MTKQKKSRRKFSLVYKRDIVRKASACKRGELAPMLAREGLTSALLTAWRREVETAVPGAEPPASKPVQVPPAADGLERDIAGWRRRIDLAEQIIEARKRLRELEAEMNAPWGD